MGFASGVILCILISAPPYNRQDNDFVELFAGAGEVSAGLREEHYVLV